MLPGGRRPRPSRRSCAGERARGRGVHRRRRDERRRLPRGAEPGRGLEAAGALRRSRTTSTACRRPATSSTPASDLADRGRRLRHARAASWTATTCSRCTRAVRRAADARAPRRRADAARVQDLPHARPRGGVGHRLRAEGAVRGVGEEGSGRALRERSWSAKGVFDEASRRDPRARTRRGSTRSPTRRSPRPEPRLDGRGEAGRRLRAEPPRPGAALRRGARPRRPSCATSTRSATACARRCAATRASSCWARTSPSTAASSRCTEGFVEEFGKARVRNTPIIESGAIGLRPGPRPRRLRARWSRCSSATSSPAASTRSSTTWRRPTTAGARACRCVIRAPVGGGTGAGPFHSQNVEAWFTRVAGLKVVAPATPFDAKGLLLAAFEDGNPVLYLEHKLLYRSAKGPRARGLLHGADRPGARWRAQGARRHRRDLRRRRVLGARGRGGARRARAARSRSSTCARSLPWDLETVVRSVREDRAAASCCTRRRSPAASAARSRRPSAARPSSGSTRRWRAWGRSTRRCRSQGARGGLLAEGPALSRPCASCSRTKPLLSPLSLARTLVSSPTE